MYNSITNKLTMLFGCNQVESMNNEECHKAINWKNPFNATSGVSLA